jgi:hypothetical protein
MSNSLPVVGGHPSGYGATVRSDNWWVGPTLTFLGLSMFIVYTTYAALQGSHFAVGPYLSPFYSPLLFTAPSGEGMGHAWIGTWPDWWPGFAPASPALLILMFPASFRLTCYYYRKAYYRSFAGSPPGCSVGPMSTRKYNGETALLLLQNLHRYALYFAIPYIPILYYDAWLACKWQGEWGFGVGTAIMFINATLLGCYTFGCHSFRHLVGGRDDCMSCGKQTLKFKAWKGVSFLNIRHMRFAWFSLFWVGFTDLYIRLVAHGVITDYNTWN